MTRFLVQENRTVELPLTEMNSFEEKDEKCSLGHIKLKMPLVGLVAMSSV